MSRSIAAPAVMILNVDPGGYSPVNAAGPSASAAPFCATARISPVDGLIATIIAFLPTRVDRTLRGVLHGAVQADGHRRCRRSRYLVENVDLGAVLVDADHAPTGLAVEFVDDGLLDLADDLGRESIVGGEQFFLRRDDDSWQAADRRGDGIGRLAEA